MMRSFGVESIGLLVTVGWVASGCGLLKKPPAPTYESEIRVESDPGSPLAGAKVTYKKKTVGISDKKGRVRVRLKGPEGQVFALAVQCPPGHRSPEKPVTVTLRRIARGAVPQYKVSCPRTVRKVVVAVRAKNGPNLPVTYLGSEIARTDQSGAAHILLEVTPNQSFQLKLDTSSQKRLAPKSPAASFEVKDEDAVLAFEQEFKVERPKVRWRPRKSSGPTPLR